MLEWVQEIDRERQHEHDFQTVREMSPEDMPNVMQFMARIGLASPPAAPDRERGLFLEKECIIRQSIDDVGSRAASSLNAFEMSKAMNIFEFAPRT